ncbi:MAG TPA: sulfatase [Gaiellaceae bacterium]|nr:sulfatase [Gaiellaceae bacterium]
MHSRRAGILALLCAGCAAAVVSAARPARARAGRHDDANRLNVVFILSDDEREDGTAVMHNVQTLLQQHGITFTNNHVTTSMCGPSRASILTGLYSHHTGVVENFGDDSYPRFDTASNLAVWLHDAGYETGLVGKYLNDYTLDGHGVVPPGWSDWQVMDSVPEERYYDYTLNENGSLVHYGDGPSDYSTTVLARKAVDFIDGARKPFFLYFAPVAPHLPAIPAPQDAGALKNLPPLSDPAINERNIGDKPWAAWHDRSMSEHALSYTDQVRERQLETLLAVDRAVGQVVDALRANGELDRTVIFYTSDNGFLWGEHRLGGKIWPYEPSTNVPLIVRTPWTEGNGTVNSEPILNVDFAPTIAQLAGVTPASPVDGASFVPFLHHESEPWRKAYLVEYLGKSELSQGGPPPYVGVHTDRYLYVEYRNGWRELYDLRRDPWELRNAAFDPAYATVRASLHTLLDRLYGAQPHRTSRS